MQLEKIRDNVFKFPIKNSQESDSKIEKVADLDNGYTRISNDLLEAIAKFPFTSRQYKIVLSVILKTYRFHKKIDWIGNKQFEEMTGLPEAKCSTIKNELIKMNVLVSNGRQCGINKNIREWKKDLYQNGKTLPKTVKKTFTKMVNSPLPKWVNTKETNYKNNKINISNSSDDEICKSIVKKIKTKKQGLDYQPILNAYNEVVLDGLPAVECLNKKRQSAIDKLSTQLRDSEISTFKAYFSRFMDLIENKQFYFGGKNRDQWRATFDYVIRLETLIKVREESL